jgi:hypothetical protein
MSKNSATVILFAAALTGLLWERPASAACGGAGERGCCLGERKENNTKGPCDKGLVERGNCERELGKTSCHCDDNLKRNLLSSGICRAEGTPIIRRDPITFPVQQCIHNQAGFIAEVRWFSDGTLTFVQQGKDNFKVTPSAPPILTERILAGQRSCVGGEGSKNWGVVTIKGGNAARVVAIIAIDIAAVGATVACAVGGTALVVATGGGSVAPVAKVCTSVGSAAVGVIADPGLVPDAKELFAVLNPPASGGTKPNWAILFGTVFQPETRIGQP